MYEFETVFDVNTGDLNGIVTGSGVHLNKDVTISFALLDQQANAVQNDQQLINNPLISDVVFDILDINGNTVYPNYLSGGTTRSITITEADNISIFGDYTKDFGVQARVFNHLDDEVFTGVFLLYGNTPIINNNFVISDSSMPYTDEAEQVFGEVVVDLSLSNNLKYMTMDRYDIYASTGNDISLYAEENMNPEYHQAFLYSQYAYNIDDIYTIRIKPIGLSYGTPYFFKIVPYSKIGSGQAISFGPNTIQLSATGSAASFVRSNNLELFFGDDSMNLGYITGATTGESDSIIDTIEKALYKTLLYTFELNHETDRISSSQLKVAIDNTGAWLTEDSINNTGQLIFSIAPSGYGDAFYNLMVSGPTGAYKLYKTSI